MIRILARKHEVLKIIPWLEPCVEFGVVGAAIACMHVCMCILWWVVGKGRRQQKVVWIKPEWKNSLSFLWALIITPREPPLHCVYLLSQLAVYTLSFSHIHMYTNSVVSPYTHTHTHTDAFQQTYKYGHKHVITTMHRSVYGQWLLTPVFPDTHTHT